MVVPQMGSDGGEGGLSLRYVQQMCDPGPGAADSVASDCGRYAPLAGVITGVLTTTPAYTCRRKL
jgi:hypothetical protein